ncbi:hypothetical protein U1701_18150 [Sphingomonas sp. PB2P19]|uniref:hypothetical protein n=1 Tax=Sphingomonas rhamnosi TaxID=3096156 RepID=UPI002FC5A233
MSESERIERVRELAGGLEEFLEYADNIQDFLLAAKLADVHALVMDRHLPPE